MSEPIKLLTALYAAGYIPISPLITHRADTSRTETKFDLERIEKAKRKRERKKQKRLKEAQK